jgi:hypothetical protein
MILPNLLRQRSVLAVFTLCVIGSVVSGARLAEAKPRKRARVTSQSYYYAGRSGPSRTWLKLTRTGDRLRGRAIQFTAEESASGAIESRDLLLVGVGQPAKVGWKMEDKDGSVFSLEFQSDSPGKSKAGAIGDARLILKHHDSGDVFSLMRTSAAEFQKALRLHGELEEQEEYGDPEPICRRLPLAHFPVHAL